jgi:pescadillo protein
VADCINAGKILLEESYWQGETLPPHFSPFGEYEGAYDPRTELAVDGVADEEEGDVAADKEAEEASMTTDVGEFAAAAVSDDAAALRTAELAAEAAGVDYGTFEKEVSKTRRKMQKPRKSDAIDGEKDMNKMMMSNKQKKLYERMKFTQRKRAQEVKLLLLLPKLFLTHCLYAALDP